MILQGEILDKISDETTAIFEPKVDLIQYTEDPNRIIATAANLCYSPQSIKEVWDKNDPTKAKGLINKLMNIGHESVIEHIKFTFGIEYVSRVLLAQITRHRLASVSVQSQRFVLNQDFKFIVPKEIQKYPHIKAKYNQFMKKSIQQYNELTIMIYRELVIKKLKEVYGRETMNSPDFNNKSVKIEKDYGLELEKKAIEEARYVLPNAAETKLVMTFNARSLFNFFKLRMCNRAQTEIRELADKMYKLVHNVCPTLFRYTGPDCTTSKCEEGSMSCGHPRTLNDLISE